MIDYTGYRLCDAIDMINDDKIHNIIKIVKLTGNNFRFNELKNPYIVRSEICDKYIVLYVTYY